MTYNFDNAAIGKRLELAAINRGIIVGKKIRRFFSGVAMIIVLFSLFLANISNGNLGICELWTNIRGILKKFCPPICDVRTKRMMID